MRRQNNTDRTRDRQAEKIIRLSTELIMQVGPFKRVKAYALSVSPSSKQIEKLWVMCVSYMQKMELCY